MRRREAGEGLRLGVPRRAGAVDLPESNRWLLLTFEEKDLQETARLMRPTHGR